jgi:hypothetical protein
MEASKWLDIQLLISAEEMEALVAHLGEFHIFSPGKVTPTGKGEIPRQQFLEVYRNYAETLKQGQLPAPLPSAVWTLSNDCLKTQTIDPSRQLLHLIKPAVQLQSHSMIYSEQDGKFYSMVYGQSSILWGIQFSYPQLYLDPETREVLKVGENFPNTALFRLIQRWVRAHTVPTPIRAPFSLNLPVRLGKECFSWIDNHLQLKNLGIRCHL